MPAKLQCEAPAGIIITHNFGFFWQSEIILSHFMVERIFLVLLAVLSFTFCVWQGFLLDEIN